MVAELLGGLASGLDVHPHQICAFEGGDGAVGECFLQHCLCHEVVFVDVVAQLVEPFFSFGCVGGLQGDDSEGVDIAHFVDVDGLIYVGMSAFVLGDDVGDVQPCDVEGFGGGDAHGTVHGERFGDGGEGGVGVSGHRELAVDFVADDKDAMLEADVAHAFEFFSGPYAPSRVVGVAEEEHLDGRIGTFLFEVLPVNHILAVHHLERIFDKGASVVADAGEEAVVHRCLDEHLVAWLCRAFDDGRDGWHDSTGVDEGCSVYRPAVPMLEPLDGGFVETFGHMGVAEAGVLYTFEQDLLNAGGNLEVHVGDPEGDDAVVVTAKSYTREYGEANPTFEYTSTGKELEGTPEISCGATAASPVGTYPIVITKGGVTNYNDSYVNGMLTITKAKLTVAAEDKSCVQNDERLPEWTIRYEGFKNGETEDVLDEKPMVLCTATSTSVAGEFVIYLQGGQDNNYEYQFVDGTLTIEQYVDVGIEGVDVMMAPLKVYTLSDQFVRMVEGADVRSLKDCLPVGLYIVNGKKVYVK